MFTRPRVYPENIQSGIVLMLAYSLFALIIDAIAKKLVFDVTTNQVIWARFIFHSLALIIFFGPKKYFKLSKTNSIKLQLIRSLLLIATTSFFFTGIYVIGLATAHSIFFLTPILVTVLAIPLLGERVGVRRSIGVLTGCVGALLIIRPGFDDFSLESLYFVAAAITGALYQLATRQLGKSDHAYVTLFYTSALGTIICSSIVWIDWQPIKLIDWMLMIALGFSAALGHFFLIKAFQKAPASALTPFSYTSLIWALIFGFWFFNELPDAETMVGSAIIISSGLYIYIRENQKNIN